MNPPIALFVYNRPNHTKRTVESLLSNPESKDHDLIIFSDAARPKENPEKVSEVRSYLSKISGFRSVTIHLQKENLGLSKSIISGVTYVLSKSERIIVMEDDLLTSRYFLSYMKESLERFADDNRVISIHGYVYPVKETLPNAFFLRGADCWGWATWRRGWNLFNPDGQQLLDELNRRELIKSFDFNGACKFSKMLRNQIKGQNDSWAVRWHASAFLANKLTLHPGRSLVHNIGNDNSGEHCDSNTTYDAKVSETPINLEGIEVAHSLLGQLAFESFYRESQGSNFRKIARLIKNILIK